MKLFEDQRRARLMYELSTFPLFLPFLFPAPLRFVEGFLAGCVVSFLHSAVLLHHDSSCELSFSLQDLKRASFLEESGHPSALHP